MARVKVWAVTFNTENSEDVVIVYVKAREKEEAFRRALTQMVEKVEDIDEDTVQHYVNRGVTVEKLAPVNTFVEMYTGPIPESEIEGGGITYLDEGPDDAE